MLCWQAPCTSYRRVAELCGVSRPHNAAQRRNKALCVPPRSWADRSPQGLSRALQRAAHDWFSAETGSACVGAFGLTTEMRKRCTSSPNYKF